MINGKKVSPERRGGRAEAGFLLVDVVCFCIVLAVVQIVSVALLEIRFTVNSPIEMFLEILGKLTENSFIHKLIIIYGSLDLEKNRSGEEL